MWASETLSEVTVLSAWMSAKRTTPETCTNSSPWFSFMVLSPCTTKFPLGCTSITVTVRLPAKLLPWVLEPSPSKLSAPARVVVKIGTPPAVMVLPRIVGPVLFTDVVLVVFVTALLLALVTSARRIVSTSPTRRALRSANSSICWPD